MTCNHAIDGIRTVAPTVSKTAATKDARTHAHTHKRVEPKVPRMRREARAVGMGLGGMAFRLLSVAVWPWGVWKTLVGDSARCYAEAGG